MPRITIRQFRAILADGPSRSALARAYGELARRPALAAAMRAADWPVWTGTPSR